MLRTASARLFGLAFFLMIVLGGMVVSTPGASAAGTPFACSGVVTNGDFERPNVANDSTVLAPGWNEYIVIANHLGMPDGIQALMLFGTHSSASQALATAGLHAGDTITIGLFHDQSVVMTLGTASVTTGSFPTWTSASISYTLQTDAEAVTFTLVSNGSSPLVDNVTASCTVESVTANDQAIEVPYEGATDGTLTATGGHDAYTFAAGTAPTKGTVDIETDGSFTYTANDGQSGSDSFTFTATDGVLPAMTDTGTVTVAIATPTALTTLPLQLTADAGEEITGTLVNQPTGGDPPYTFLPNSGVGLGGIFVVAVDGSFTYTTFPDASGTDTFTYTVIDDQATPAATTGSVNVTITAADAVVADDQSIDVPYEGALSFTLKATGGFGGYTFAEGTAPTKGTVEIEPDGFFLYTAYPGQSGSDSFTFTATDTVVPALIGTGTVTVTIASPDTLATLPLVLTADAGEEITGALANQVTGGDPPYAFVADSLPSQGSVTISPDGSFSYVANPDASGSDSFTYSVSDDQATPAATTGSVNVTITAADAVVANDQAIDVAYEGSIDGTLTATGGFGAYTFAAGTAPTKGSVTINPDGTFTYTANSGQSGTDTFTFTATDSVLATLTDSGTVTVPIAAPNGLTTLPLAISVDAGETMTGNLTDQITGGDSPYSFALDANPVLGTVTIDADGSFSYTAGLAGSGSDSFTYTVTDDQASGSPTTGTVTITILATPIPDTTVQVTGDPRFPITGSAAIPGEPGLTYTLDTAPGIGSVVVNPNGTFTYTVPSTVATGDSFTVLATAPDGETALVAVVVTFEIDPTLSTKGTVKPGGTGNGGGTPNDARDGVPAQPQPTSVPSDDSNDDDGRVERP